MDTVAVIVTYNRKDLLKESIEALCGQTRPSDIMVVDNASTDGTEEMVREIMASMPEHSEHGKIIYHNMGENLGGAGGFSFGVKQAYNEGYKYIWLMDDDCIVKEDSLEELFNADKKLEGDYGFLCSKVIWTDGSICKTNVQRYPMAKRIKDFDSELVRVNYATFVSMFFKREIVKEVGIPIKDFFIWSDDLEYTQRVSKKHPSYLCNKSVVIHKTKGNNGINIAIEAPERYSRFKHIYRNDVYVFRNEGLKGWAYLFFRGLYHIYKVLRYSKDNKWDKIRTIVKGNVDGVFFHPKVEYVE